jgi:hypothetical protein
MQAATGEAPAAFIFHHTSGRGTVAGVADTLRQRGLGVEYAMERDGTIKQIGGPGAFNIKSGWGVGKGLSNKNIIGMEVIAKDDKDVTPAQVAAAEAFIKKNYPNTPVFGHGEVNPGHKEADEGMKIVNTIRRERETLKSPSAPGAPTPQAVASTETALRQPVAAGGSTTPASDLPGLRRREGLPASALQGVDPKLREIMAAAQTHLRAGYSMVVTSGYRAPTRQRRGSERSMHGRGEAIDVQIFDPHGQPIPNEGSDRTGMYTRLARAALTEQLKRYPDLKDKLAWGGAFGTQIGGGGPPDLMHFDLGGDRGHWIERRLAKLGPLTGESDGNQPIIVKPTAAEDRAAVDVGARKVRTVKIEANGKLRAEVNAPHGTEVKVEGGGAFKKTETERKLPTVEHGGGANIPSGI